MAHWGMFMWRVKLLHNVFLQFVDQHLYLTTVLLD